MTAVAMPERDLAALAACLAQRGSAVHMVGIGGVGMAGLAALLAAAGHVVRGTDACGGALVDWLRQRGVDVAIGHAAGHVAPDAAWAVRSMAVPPANPELDACRTRGIPVFLRGAALAALARGRRTIAVSGTHGKTTTTTMITQVLVTAGLDPSFAIGGDVPALGGPARQGQSPWLVVEADESDGTVALYAPEVAVITNIEYDHMEHFASRAAMEACFEQFAAQARRVVFCADDPVAARIGRQIPGAMGYGFDAGAEVRGLDVALEADGAAFRVECRKQDLGAVRLPVPGRQNVQNALAALAVARALDLDWAPAVAALAQFSNARRRMELVAEGAGITVLSDYAHHPTEIRVTIQAAALRRPRRIIAMFQPHRYTRTLALGPEFPPAFEGLDHLFLAPVYAASEAPLAGGASADLARRFPSGFPLTLAPSLAAAWEGARAMLRPGDLLLILGAGDIEQAAAWARDFVSNSQTKESTPHEG